MAEVWLPIDGYKYEISDRGRVRNSTTERVLKLAPFSNCYLGVNLGQGKRHLVHRLVAKAFVPGYVEGLDVNHKDGDRANNVPTNLEWCTRSENIAHGYRELPRKRHAKALPVAVKGQGFVALFPDQSALARLLNVRPGSVASALLNNHRVKGCEVAYV